MRTFVLLGRWLPDPIGAQVPRLRILAADRALRSATNVAAVGATVRTEIDGVTTLWADASGPLVANLQFRVGQCDEWLGNRGITHLCEHLLLSQFGNQGYEYNGSTGTTVTNFVVVGRPDEVVWHLWTVVDSLVTGRFLERLEHERRVLAIEGSQRGISLVGDHSLIRYGAAGPGLVDYGELGLNKVDRDDVWKWAAQYFVRQNAVLWLNGPPPQDLRLPLLDGTPNRRVFQPFQRGSAPVWVERSGPPAITAQVARSAAAVEATQVLGRRITDQLRHQHGVAYSPTAEYVRLDGSNAVVVAATESSAEHAGYAAWTIAASLENLAGGGATDAELAAVRSARELGQQHPDSVMGRVVLMADELLHSGQCRSEEEMAADERSIDAAAVHRAAWEMWRDEIVQIPPGIEVPQWSIVRFDESPAPDGSGARTFHRRDYAGHSNYGSATLLWINNSSLSLFSDAGPFCTVPLDGSTVAIAFGDGGRGIAGHDGTFIEIRPTSWHGGDEVIALIDRAIGPLRTVAGRARSMGPAGSHQSVFRSASARRGPDPATVGPMYLDDWFIESALPADVPARRRPVVPALIVGWLAHRGLLSDWVEASIDESLAAFRAGNIWPLTLFDALGNALNTDLASARAAVFLADSLVPLNSNSSPPLVTWLDGRFGSAWNVTEQDAVSVWSLLDEHYSSWKPSARAGALAGWISPNYPSLPVPSSRAQRVS